MVRAGQRERFWLMGQRIRTIAGAAHAVSTWIGADRRISLRLDRATQAVERRSSRGAVPRLIRAAFPSRSGRETAGIITVMVGPRVAAVDATNAFGPAEPRAHIPSQ
jgi:hypothetical protein